MIGGGGGPANYAIVKRFLQEGASKIVWRVPRKSNIDATIEKMKTELVYPEAPIIKLVKTIEDLDLMSFGEDNGTDAFVRH